MQYTSIDKCNINNLNHILENRMKPTDIIILLTLVCLHKKLKIVVNLLEIFFERYAIFCEVFDHKNFKNPTHK